MGCLTLGHHLHPIPRIFCNLKLKPKQWCRLVLVTFYTVILKESLTADTKCRYFLYFFYLSKQKAACNACAPRSTLASSIKTDVLISEVVIR